MVADFSLKDSNIKSRHISFHGRFLSWNLLWLLLFAVGFGFFLIGMPKYTDDYWLMTPLRNWFESQGVDYPEDGGNIFRTGIPWESLKESFIYRYHSDNVRLGNTIGVFLLMFPKWVGSGGSLIMLMWSVLMILRIAGERVRTTRYMALVLFAVTFGLPWFNYFGSLIYQVNYIWPSTLALLFFRLLMRFGERKRVGYGTKTAIFTVGILTGFWHEAFAVLLISGLAVLMILDRKWRSAELVMLMVILTIGTLLLVSVPGMRLRYDRREDITLIQRLSGTASFLLKSGYVFLIMTVALGVRIKHRGFKKTVCNPLIAFFAASSVGCLILQFVSQADMRLGYWMELSSVIILLIELKSMAGSGRLKWLTGRTTSVILLAVTYSWLAFTGYYSIRFRMELRKSLRQYIETSAPNLYGEAPLPHRFHEWNDYDFYVAGALFVKYYYGHEKTTKFGNCPFIVPSVLEEVESGAGADAGEGSDVRKYKDYYFIAVEDMPDYNGERERRFDIDSGDGPEEEMCITTPFRSLRDGKTYIWILPRLSQYIIKINRIKTIKPHEYR